MTKYSLPCLCAHAHLFPSGSTYCKLKQCIADREKLYPCKDRDASKRFTLVKVSDIMNPSFTFFSDLGGEEVKGIEVKKISEAQYKREKKKTLQGGLFG